MSQSKRFRKNDDGELVEYCGQCLENHVMPNKHICSHCASIYEPKEFDEFNPTLEDFTQAEMENFLSVLSSARYKRMGFYLLNNVSPEHLKDLKEWAYKIYRRAEQLEESAKRERFLASVRDAEEKKKQEKTEVLLKKAERRSTPASKKALSDDAKAIKSMLRLGLTPEGIVEMMAKSNWTAARINSTFVECGIKRGN